MASRPPALRELCLLRPLALAFLLRAAKGFPEPRPCPLTAKAGPANLAEAWGWGLGGPLNRVAILSWGLGDGTQKGKDKIGVASRILRMGRGSAGVALG